MSGRKQHYIPQFVLRAFGESTSGKKVQIRVTARDRTFVVPTDGAAAQREFYSALDSDMETLDDVITSAEGEYFSLFDGFLKQKHDTPINNENVAKLLTHLAVRGNYIRQSLSTFGSYAIAKITAAFSDPEYFKRALGVGRAEPSEYLIKLFDEKYHEHRNEFIKKKISRFDFRNMMFAEFNSKWSVYFDDNVEMIKTISSLMNFEEMAAESHQKILSKDIEPQARVENLAKFDWEILDFTSPTFCLPDCIGLAHSSEFGLMPVGFVGNDDLRGAIFPLSPTRALCCGVYREGKVLEAARRNFAACAASCSWDFVVTPPTYAKDWIPQNRIGDALITMMYEQMEKAMSEHLSEMMI